MMMQPGSRTIAIPLGPQTSLKFHRVDPAVFPHPEHASKRVPPLLEPKLARFPVFPQQEVNAAANRLRARNPFALAVTSQLLYPLVREFNDRPHGVIIP